MSRTALRIIAIAALLAASTLAVGESQRAPSQTVYDVYEKGIRRGEVVVDRSARTTRVTTRSRALREWGEPATVGWGEADRRREIRLFGAIRDLPARLPELEEIDWVHLPAVGWPDGATIYDRHREQRAPVGGTPTRAYHFAQRDASRPLDLLIAADNRLIAGIDPTGDFVMVRRGFEVFTVVGDWLAPEVSQAEFALEPPRRHAVPGGDGLTLTTLVYLPDARAARPLPTILVRTPYGIGNLIASYWHHVARGYAVVLQSARGTSHLDPANRSEGPFEAMAHEAEDGAMALDWITAQPWSDGSVCMQGGSYLGYTQWSATMARNPALKCIVPESSMGTAFTDQPYMGGGFVQGMAYYLLFMLDKPTRPGLSWTEILQHRPLADIDRFATGEDLPLWNAFMRHWRNDEYWRARDWYRDSGPRDVASLQLSGWFDDDFPGTRANWELMQQHGTRPQRLVIGPWKHGYNVDRALNGFRFGADAVRPDIWLLKQRWFDRHLKGMGEALDERQVDYFVLGSNQWRSADRWPPAEARPERWYLHSAGSAHRSGVDGGLQAQAPAQPQPADEYRYDPADPPRNWYSFDRMERWQDVQSFPYDFKDIEARHDIATYTSAPLVDDLTIAGDVMLDLYASTDVRDTDWWVHLSDVYPDNSSVRLTVGMLRARFRNLDDPEQRIRGSNFEHEELLSGDLDDIVHYRIAIPSIANTFRAGHQVRVAVFNALDNYAFPNSNTGEDESTVTGTVVGTMRIHHGPGRASFVTLPVVGRSPD